MKLVDSLGREGPEDVAQVIASCLDGTEMYTGLETEYTRKAFYKSNFLLNVRHQYYPSLHARCDVVCI